MNNGKATRDQESRLFQDELAIKPPIFDHIDIVGGSEKLYKSMVKVPVAKRENPIHKPDNKKENKIITITIKRIKGSEITAKYLQHFG